ncbi:MULTISPECIES: DinB family protein [Streptomyces]|uniref:DinB family protein n=1 Tax=Streptomyces TaxID=1883 RepID=UPI0004BDC0A9|nr:MULTISPECIES: DinB family protein [Streptomyces]KJY19058.1 Mini-circle protein [Streptomyces sp. NRRL S-104]KOU29986.1 Mini-circle protein [Streptomyces sp. WM6373]KOU66277.1 Mini-circle protein [Streptomyces sp. IGB124]KOU70794.1 Mini-circle protein [Streptomyces sp. XY66]KOU97524.1 Mini-circle protein [Streptomyces sp. XY58]
MTTSSGSHRDEPSTTADEREMLDGWLDYHRATLLWKCEGLQDEELRRTPLAPSELSLLGLVRHMAEVERYWFRQIMLGEDVPDLFVTDEDRDGDFHFTGAATWAEAEQAWRTEVERARRAAAGRSLDLVSKAESHHRGEVFSLRWVYTHMIEEYARHNGHADLLREQIDGATGE